MGFLQLNRVAMSEVGEREAQQQPTAGQASRVVSENTQARVLLGERLALETCISEWTGSE